LLHSTRAMLESGLKYRSRENPVQTTMESICSMLLSASVHSVTQLRRAEVSHASKYLWPRAHQGSSRKTGR
jgi:hypothetical protein